MPESNTEPRDAGVHRTEACAGSDTENPTVVPGARRDPAAERARRLRLVIGTALVSTLLVAAFTWVYLGRDDVNAESATGFFVGMAFSLLGLLVILWWGVRRGGTSFSRSLSGREDERDKEIWRRAWALTGKVAWVAVLVLMICEMWGAELRLPLNVAMWVNVVVLFGSRFYYDRRM